MATNGKTALTVRRTPFDALEEFRESFPSLFDLRWPFSLRAGRLPEESHPPSVDMFERDGKLVVKAEMPGIAPDAIDVTVSDGELRISGERKEEKEVREENYYRSERSYGRIYRALPLPQGCDSDNVTATAKDGIVEIVIPKKAAAVGKKIDVKSA
jgi:HSP20 family protein